jgi:hypothetical protein
MKILVDLASLRQVQWYEHLTRFLMGGIITVLAGLVAKAFGPAVGGGCSWLFRRSFRPARRFSISTSEKKSKKPVSL